MHCRMLLLPTVFFGPSGLATYHAKHLLAHVNAWVLVVGSLAGGVRQHLAGFEQVGVESAAPGMAAAYDVQGAILLALEQPRSGVDVVFGHRTILPRAAHAARMHHAWKCTVESHARMVSMFKESTYSAAPVTNVPNKYPSLNERSTSQKSAVAIPARASMLFMAGIAAK